MEDKACITKQPKGLSLFERYLTVWVIFCIVAGIVMGKLAPKVATFLDGLSIYVNEAPVLSIPIAICLFFMMYPIMVKIDFADVLKAGKSSLASMFSRDSAVCSDAEDALVTEFSYGVLLARIPLFLFQAVQAALLPRLSQLAARNELGEFRSGLKRYWLGPGVNPYKARWTDQGEPLFRIAGYSPTAKGRLLQWHEKLIGQAKIIRAVLRSSRPRKRADPGAAR